MIVDITPKFKMKIKAMSLYRSQIRVFPNILKCLRALAQVRGYLIDRPYADLLVPNGETSFTLLIRFTKSKV